LEISEAVEQQEISPGSTTPGQGGEWTLAIGIHNGTRLSRDTEDPRKLANLEKCQAAVTQAEKGYASMGYFIWFATAKGPDGKEHSLKHKHVPYR